MKTLEQIRKEKKEIERRLLFLQHKDRHSQDDRKACYNMNQAIIKLANEVNNYEESNK
jgi:hypothetical protein